MGYTTARGKYPLQGAYRTRQTQNTRCTINTQYTLYTIHYTLYTINIHHTPYTLHRTIRYNTVQYNVQYTTPYTVHSTLHTIHNTEHTIHSTQSTVRQAPEATINWQPSGWRERFLFGHCGQGLGCACLRPSSLQPSRGRERLFWEPLNVGSCDG